MGRGCWARQAGPGFPGDQALVWAGAFPGGEVQLAGWVGGENVPFGEPCEVILEGAETGTLGADAQRHAVFLAPVPKVALVAFEDGLGDGGGVSHVAVDGPQQENLEGVAAALNGVRGVIAHGELFQIVGGVPGETARVAGRDAVGDVAAPVGAVALAELVRGLKALFPGHDDCLLVRCYWPLGMNEGRYAYATTNDWQGPDLCLRKATRLSARHWLAMD